MNGQGERAKYQACDNLVSYKGRRVEIVGRWYSPLGWSYDVRDWEWANEYYSAVPQEDLTDYIGE